MATVCVGPEFSPDEQGRLRLRACGNPPEQAWPYPCPPVQGNPLRIDPDCGVWVPPRAQAARVSVFGQTAVVNLAVPAAFQVIETASITLTNPSDCYEAMVIPFLATDVDLELPAGSRATAAVRTASNEILQLTNPAPSGGTTMGATHVDLVQPIFDAAPIPAGGTKTYTWNIEVGDGAGNARWRAARWQVHALMLAGLT
ncbi:hypothetical protein SAMN05443665_101740 [Actinomadura meyerae]|uniref:Uncharacterized protein n=1 Tax=Actinomadura meyerae TaxID=240840 RepID=A0A239KAH8_9ACTN|nr:hypothetical protein [Actinomadura meyerae]SNT14114.1 hypothetical protein SAMN05443665_101740 [Actinomadura meyerae]